MKASATSSCTSTRWIEMQLWPGVREGVQLRLVGGRLPVAVGVDDQRRVGAQLQVDLLVGDAAADPPADFRGAGEGERAGQLVLDDRVADLRSRPGDDAQPALRQSRLDQDRGQLQRRDRRLPGRLQHHRVAGGDRRAELVGDEVEREVEGTDRADHAVGDAQHHAELAGAGRRGLHRHGAPGQLARLDRGEGEGVDAALGLDPRGLQRLAGLGGDRQRQVVASLGDQLGGAVQHRGALVLGEVARLEGGLRGDHRPVDQRRVALRHPADDRPVVGALNLVPARRSPIHSPAARSLWSTAWTVCVAIRPPLGLVQGRAGRDSFIPNLLTGDMSSIARSPRHVFSLCLLSRSQPPRRASPGSSKATASATGSG